MLVERQGQCYSQSPVVTRRQKSPWGEAVRRWEQSGGAEAYFLPAHAAPSFSRMAAFVEQLEAAQDNEPGTLATVAFVGTGRACDTVKPPSTATYPSS